MNKESLHTLEQFVAEGNKAKAAKLIADIENNNARVAWSNEIMTSPEAQSRPRAARRLVEIASPATHDVDRARAVLRGIAPEVAGPETGPERPTPTGGAALPAPKAETDQEYRARRAAEIRLNTLTFRANRGDEETKRALRELRLAAA